MRSFGNSLAVLAILFLAQWISGGHAFPKPVSKQPVRFEITLTWEDHEVAGITRKTILSNGQFPGPTLQLQQGDDVVFVVKNQLPFSTTVHFHGIEQQGTPWSDGVPGLSQRPIESGDYFVYRWTASQYGSYFYHAHRRGQIEDGLYGPIYVHPSHETERPFGKISGDPLDHILMREAEKSTQPIMLSDWRALTSEEIWQAEEDSGYDAYCANAMLVNGKGSVQCLSEEVLKSSETEAMKAVLEGHALTDIGCLYPTNIVQGNYSHDHSALPSTVFDGCTPTKGETEIFRVDPEVRWVSWDLIASTGVSTPEFSIDEHPMWVYAVDGRYVEPMEVHSVTITNGARYSVLVKLDKPAGDYTIRVPNYGVNQILNATAILSYDVPHKVQVRPSEPYIDIVGANTTAETIILDETKVVPFPAITPSNDIDRTFKLIIDHHDHSYRWIMGNNSFDMDYENSTPLLFNRTSIPTGLTISTRNGTWVDIIVEAHNPVQPPHPIHKHSNKYFVIGQGSGDFNYSTVAEAMEHIPESFNLRTPQIRDTFVTPAVQSEPTWLALRYQVVNPGPFLLHCHVQVHLNGGMAVALLDGVDKWPTVPEGYELPAVEDN